MFTLSDAESDHRETKGSAEADRRTCGWGYLLVGLVVAVVCLARLA